MKKGIIRFREIKCVVIFFCFASGGSCLQLVKHTPSVKLNKVKYNEMRYACINKAGRYSR